MCLCVSVCECVLGSEWLWREFSLDIIFLKDVQDTKMKVSEGK